MKCGSIWVCSPCSSRITEQRRQELQTAITNSSDQLVPVLVTYTVQHHKNMHLADLLAAMLQAYRKLRSGRLWQLVKEEYLIVGGVRATEITIGPSGWHPHFHELLFLDADIFKSEPAIELITSSLQRQLTSRWIEALKTVSLSASSARAIDVRSARQDVADYVAKYGHMPHEQESGWTLAHEVTKAGSKTAIDAHRNMWHVLSDYGQGDQQSGAYFQEYAAATKGRAQLVWTKGLKSRLHIDEISDELALDETTDDEQLLASLDAGQWRVVLAHNAVGQLLAVGHSGEMRLVHEFLDNLAGMQAENPYYFRRMVYPVPICLQCAQQLTPVGDDPGTGGQVWICDRCGAEHVTP